MAERRFSGKFDNICDFVIDWQGLDQRNSARANEIRTVPISLYRLHQNRKRDCSENGNKNSDHRVITFSKGGYSGDGSDGVQEVLEPGNQQSLQKRLFVHPLFTY